MEKLQFIPGTKAAVRPLSGSVSFYRASRWLPLAALLVSVLAPGPRGFGAPLPPVATVLASKNSAVPGAGVAGSGVPAGAVWSTFGIPSINQSGQVAFAATYKAGATTLSGLFAGDASEPRLVAKKGAPAPGIAGAVFGSFKDPVFADNGSVAFVATLANAPGKDAVSAISDSTLWFDADGAGAGKPVLVAREIAGAAGVPGGQWKAFTSIALNNELLVFTATLLTGAGVVTPANDGGVWTYRPATRALNSLLREGNLFDGVFMKTISTLVARPGTPGAGRWLGSDGSLLVRVTGTNNERIVATVRLGEFPDVFVETGEVNVLPFPWGVGYVVTSVGLPSLGGSTPAFLSTLRERGEDVLYQTLFASQAVGSYGLVRANDWEVPGVASSYFTGFLDPVTNDQKAVAFIGTIGQAFADTGVGAANDTGIWLFTGDAISAGTAPTYPTASGRLLAREGATPPEVSVVAVPAGVEAQPRWASFTSLALPDGGIQPLFVATMTSATNDPVTGNPTLPGPGGVTLADDVGLWGVDSGGALRLLIREGQVIEGKTLKAFAVLGAVVGSPGQARSLNRTGAVLYRAVFTDGSQAVVRVQVP